MSRWNVGNIPPVTADEDLDKDVEIMENEDARRVLGHPIQKSARVLIEELKESKEWFTTLY